MRVYLSHPIRGKYGKNATHTQMKENYDKALEIANQIRTVLPIDVYVPAEHEDFVSRAYYMGYLTEKQLLNVDCKIISDTCDLVIIYVPKDDKLQGGRLVEYDYAVSYDIPVILFRKVKDAIHWLACQILRS